MRTIRRAALLLLALLVVCACGPGAATAVGQSQSCRSSMGEGRCEGSIRTVRGPYTYDIETDGVMRGTPYRVWVELSVDTSEMRVFVGSADEPNAEAIARPGEPVSIEGVAEVGAFDAVQVGMYVAEGQEATGVSYTIIWERD